MARTYSRVNGVHRPLKVDKHEQYQRGDDVRELQASCNRRLKARGQHQYVVKVDGEYGPATARACSRALYLLGIHGTRFSNSKVKNGGKLSEAAQDLIRHPGKRTRAMLDRARSRLKAVEKAEAARSKGRGGAVRYGRRYAGHTTERPANSNRGGMITTWQKALGSWLVGLAWCGTFCAACLRAAGVKGINYRMASVAYIEDDARRGRGPFRGWTTDWRRVRPGDLVVLFGRGVHVALVTSVSASGVHTVEGNTSPGSGGSQSNGGGVYERFRPHSNVHGFALVRF